MDGSIVIIRYRILYLSDILMVIVLHCQSMKVILRGILTMVLQGMCWREVKAWERCGSESTSSPSRTLSTLLLTSLAEGIIDSGTD